MRLNGEYFLAVLALAALACRPTAVQERAAVAELSQLKWEACGAPLPEGCEDALVHGNPAEGPSDFFVRTPKSYLFPRPGTRRLNTWS